MIFLNGDQDLRGLEPCR